MVMWLLLVYIFYFLLPCDLQYVEENLGVMSVGFLLTSPSDAVIWRGPKKNGAYSLSL